MIHTKMMSGAHDDFDALVNFLTILSTSSTTGSGTLRALCYG